MDNGTQANPAREARPKKSTGTVVQWCVSGFGFIMDNQSRERIFVHVSHCPDHQPLEVGACVRYTVQPRRGKWMAVDVELDPQAKPRHQILT